MNGLAYPSRVLGRANRVVSAATSRWSLAHWLATPAGAVALIAVGFIAINCWWAARDTGVPDSATGNHILVAIQYHDAFQSGHDWTWFNAFNIYPPLIHVVGAIAMLIGGVSIKYPIMAENLVFVPLLAIGCYGTGALAYDRRVGALAALFAVGTPMVISQFHVFMLDVPMAALAAVSVWLLIASNRFENVWYSGAAGVAVALGMMTKNTFAFFVLGPVLVGIASGGWRHWRGLLAFAALGLAIAAPWHLKHLSELRGYAEGSVVGQSATLANVPRTSIRNYLWYGVNVFEHQLYVPLGIFLFAGIAVAVRRFVRAPRESGFTLDLLAGLLVGYLAMTMLNLKDPRYTLPLLVYGAVLGTAWLLRPDRTLRAMPSVALVLIVAVNTIAIDLGVGGSHRISLPGEQSSPEGNLQRKLTFLAPPAFAEGRAEPRRDHVIDLLRAEKRRGARLLYIAGGADDWNAFNSNGLTIFARMVGLDFPANNDPHLLRRSDFFLIRRPPVGPADPPPCLRLQDGTGVYVSRGGTIPIEHPFERLPFNCPAGFGAG